MLKLEGRLLLLWCFLPRRLTMRPAVEKEIAAELEDLEDHDDGDAEVETERAADARSEALSLTDRR